MAFIAAHVARQSVDGLRWGVQPICRVLTEHGCKIDPSTYHASLTRAPSARERSDELMLIETRRVHDASSRRYGADKVEAEPGRHRGGPLHGGAADENC